MNSLHHYLRGSVSNFRNRYIWRGWNLLRCGLRLRTSRRSWVGTLTFITVFGTYVEVPSVPDLEDLLKLAPLRAPSFADGADTDDGFTGLAFFGFETTASLTSSTKVTLRGSPFFRRIYILSWLR